MSIFSERYSCRAYDGRPVGRELLLKVLEDARLAPSAVNRQPWTFIVVEGPEGRRVLQEAYDREWFKTAPLYIICVGHHDSAWHRQADGKDHTDIDVAIAAEHICLSATAYGLATCWVCNFDAAPIRKNFGLKDSDEPIAIIPVGYADAGAKVPEKIRKDINEIVEWCKI